MKKMLMLPVFAACLAEAADFTWLANPVNENWLGAANWSQGEWVNGAGNKAVFGASSVTDLNVNGSVEAGGVTVNAGDYSFTNGSLTVKGSFSVGEGARANVESGLHGVGTETRFVKTGKGELIVKGNEASTNTFERFAVRGGRMVLDGGTHFVTGKSDGATDAKLAGSFANSSALEIKGGAHLVFTNQSSYIANSGCDLLVSDGLFDCFQFNEFLNGFGDNNGSDQAKCAQVTVRDKGVFKAKVFRLGKVGTTAAFNTPQYAALNIETGGVFQVRQFTMDNGANSKYVARLNANGGTLEFVDNPGDSTSSLITRFNMSVESSWTNVSLNILKGGLTIKNSGSNSYLTKGFLSGDEEDGGITITGGGNVYFNGAGTYKGGTRLESNVWFCVISDAVLGAAPEVPTTNVIFKSSGNVFHFAKTCDLHTNRNFWIEKGVNMRIGAAGSQVGRINGTIGGPDDGSYSAVTVLNNWPGEVAFDPGENRTNHIGKLSVYGRLNIESGTTLITSNSNSAVNNQAGFYVSRDPSNGVASFSDTQGILRITGGRVVVTNFMYTQVSGGGQVYVDGGVLDASASREWLNGLSSVGRTVVQNGGELIAPNVRISQCGTVDTATGVPLCSISVNTGGVLRLRQFYLDTNYNAGNAYQRGWVYLNGGTLAARMSTASFMGTSAVNWTNIQFRVCAGGAKIDSNGFDISAYNALVTGAEVDGGVTKLGNGKLTLQGKNTYNGPTRLEGGTLVFSNTQGYPGGNLDIPASVLATATDRTTPLVTMNALTFREGCSIRVVDVTDEYRDKVRSKKVIASFTQPLSSAPAVIAVDADGTVHQGTPWRATLSNGGKTLSLAYYRGTTLIIR